MPLTQRNLGFDLLLDAVRNEQPGKVVGIVKENPSFIGKTNSIGENVLTWCALELMYEEVELLRSLGSPIQEQAVSESIQHGNTEMLLLLLELGGDITDQSAAQSLRIAKSFGSDSRRLHILKSHLEAYGINV